MAPLIVALLALSLIDLATYGVALPHAGFILFFSGQEEEVAAYTRGGEGLQKVAFPSRDHRGKYGFRGIRVRHDVDVPVALPAVEVGLAHVPAGSQDTGVRAEQIDLPVFGQNARHERGHVAFARDIA